MSLASATQWWQIRPPSPYTINTRGPGCRRQKEHAVSSLRRRSSCALRAHSTIMKHVSFRVLAAVHRELGNPALAARHRALGQQPGFRPPP